MGELHLMMLRARSRRSVFELELALQARGEAPKRPIAARGLRRQIRDQRQATGRSFHQTGPGQGVLSQGIMARAEI